MPKESEWKCDAGAFELGIETHRVCGAPLLVSNADPKNPQWAPGAENLCDLTSITAALAESQPEDTIVVNGVVTETVTINKNITIRGPSDEQTPAWHLGIVQARNAAPDGSPNLSPIFTVNSGITAVLQDLNLRYGDGTDGGAILNNGNLTVERVTLYSNRAEKGAAIYNSGTLIVTDSTVTRNLGSAAGAGIYNASGATATVKRSHRVLEYIGRGNREQPRKPGRAIHRRLDSVRARPGLAVLRYDHLAGLQPGERADLLHSVRDRSHRRSAAGRRCATTAASR